MKRTSMHANRDFGVHLAAPPHFDGIFSLVIRIEFPNFLVLKDWFVLYDSRSLALCVCEMYVSVTR